MSGLDFEDFFTAEQQDEYYLMFSIDTYEKFHPDFYDYVTSGGYRQLTGGLTTDVLESLSNTLNSIYTWLQSSETKYLSRWNAYR